MAKANLNLLLHPIPVTPWQRHVAKWRDCRECDLCEQRKNVVLARGTIPCDILYAGESPGRSEDILGQPFMGPAGKLLDDIIAQATPMDYEKDAPEGSVPQTYLRFTHAMCNLICCIPRGDDGEKVSEPSEESILACQPRLREFVILAQPKLIILVGKFAQDYFDQQYKHSVKLPKSSIVPMVSITHPSALLRQPIAVRGLNIKRCIVQISNAIEKHLLGED